MRYKALFQSYALNLTLSSLVVKEKHGSLMFSELDFRIRVLGGSMAIVLGVVFSRQGSLRTGSQLGFRAS